MQERHSINWLILITITLFLISCVGCSNEVSEEEIELTKQSVIAINLDAPSYVRVRPEKGSQLEDSTQEVCVYFSYSNMEAETGLSAAGGYIADSIRFFVDGLPVDARGVISPNALEPIENSDTDFHINSMTFCFSFEVNKQIHVMNYQFDLPSGEEFQYYWYYHGSG